MLRAEWIFGVVAALVILGAGCLPDPDVACKRCDLTENHLCAEGFRCLNERCVPGDAGLDFCPSDGGR